GFAINGPGFGRFGPLDDVITMGQTLATAKIRSAVRRETAHAVDATLLEQHHLGPGADQAIGKQDIARLKQIPQGAEHAQLALALAGVPADAEIQNGS